MLDFIPRTSDQPAYIDLEALIDVAAKGIASHGQKSEAIVIYILYIGKRQEKSERL